METMAGTTTQTTQEIAPGGIPGFSGAPGDLQADLARIAAAQAPAPASVVAPVVQQEAQQEVVEPKVPATPEPAQPPPAAAIPEKFQNKDGTPNSDKIAKSTVDAELAYQKFLEIERGLHRKREDVQRLSNSRAAEPQTQDDGQVQPSSPFAQQIEQDVKKYGLGAVLVELHVAAKRAAYAEATRDIQDIRQESQESKRRRELESLAKHDEWIISPEGTEALGKVLEAKPWLWQAPKPWEEAYKSHIAEKQMNQRLLGQVQTPIPKASTVSAPATPVGAAPRVQNPVNVATMNKDQINSHMATLSEADKVKFFAERGLRFK